MPSDVCVLCRIDPAVITVGDHRLCLDCSDDYSQAMED